MMPAPRTATFTAANAPPAPARAGVTSLAGRLLYYAFSALRPAARATATQMEPAAQPLSPTERPELAVVVPSVNGLGDLRGCLDALTREATGVRLEVLVPERCGDEVRHAVAREYPWVRVLAVGPEKTIPEMRALAFREAGGLVIAVIEDHVIVPPGWARRMLDEIRAGADDEHAMRSFWNGWRHFMLGESVATPALRT